METQKPFLPYNLYLFQFVACSSRVLRMATHENDQNDMMQRLQNGFSSQVDYFLTFRILEAAATASAPFFDSRLFIKFVT